VDILAELAGDCERIVNANLKKTTRWTISDPGYQGQSADVKRGVQREIISGVLSKCKMKFLFVSDPST